MSDNNAGHTPGPWNVFEDSFRDVIYVGAGSGEEICIPLGPKANAQLIAAAPELLEAAKELHREYGHHMELDHEERLRNAIAKAEGREEATV